MDGPSDEPDPWGELGARYHRDEDAQFLLFVEQLHEARSLVDTEDVAKIRMALVAVDNLAEVLLHRHKRRVLRLGGDWHGRVPRLSSRDLDRFKKEFGTRVSLACRGTEDALLQRSLRPLLDARDEAIF